MAFNKEKVMDAARKFVDKGQIDKAVKEYLRIVHEDPKDVRVWLKIGDLYAKKGSKQDATETYLKVARFYHDQGFFLKAVAVYKQILKLDPRLVDVILKLAELYRQLGLMSDAMQHFESVAAHFHREGNTKEALATVKKLVDLDPENIATRIKLAELYSKEGLVEDAGQEFQVACEQLRRQGRQDDFVKVAERLLWHKPDNHLLNRELAGLYLRRNDPRRALQKLQACFKHDPRDIETLALLAQAFQALDQKAKTVSVLKELARVHLENKAKDKAGEVYRKILEFVPTDADALGYFGQGAAAPVGAAPPAPPARASAPPPPPMPRLQTPMHAQMQTPMQTPMPSPIRAATNEAKFNLTGDMPSLGNTAQRMTGSMPLIDEQSLSGVDFALPEYDDADFSADMEPAPDPRQMSAAGERHAEEISKILAETDVYVKYGLHQKAVDHLRRVFSLDPENVEAHERLKDIFIGQGREQEAEGELLKLAELIAPADPDRAEQYLQELLAMNGTHTGAFELARRFRLRVARMSSVSSEVSYDGGGVAAVDADLDDLDLSDPVVPASAIGVARTRGGGRGGQASRDSVDDFDPDELLGRVAHGSPTPQRPPVAPPSGWQADQDQFDLEFDPLSTRQSDHGDELDDPIIVDSSPPHQNWGDETVGGADAVDAQLDDDALGHSIDNEIAAEMGADPDLPFDPDEARAFDMAVPKGETAQQYVSGFDDTELPEHPAHPTLSSVTDSYPGDHVEDDLGVSGSYDPYGTEAVQTPPYDPTASHVVGGMPGLDDSGSAPRAETNVEDDLDEADFYAGQGMYAEAIDVLRAVLDRVPHHKLVNAKLREIESLASGGVAAEEAHPESIEQNDYSQGTEALDLDEIEEVEVDELDELSDNAPPKKKRGPTVMLENPVEEGDADTHYDLGLAYKEMGLYDEAIKAFEKALRAPIREVQCRIMIGICQREMGNTAEAIQQFKQGLHAEPQERERQSIYYEIGMTYESIGDDSEALYYFEMITKRDPTFADAGARAESLRVRGAGRSTRRHDDIDDI
ncbi:MAG: tetratricopeptide repeat protein [Deltaproteobacteria bacterium]|nr:tetratricopeptide repeat protein [Deltaproteobacteria bacterium]